MAVDDPRPRPLQRGEIMLGVEDPMPVAANVGGRRHAVEEQREITVGFADVEAMLARVDTDVLGSAAVEFGEQGTKPVLVLVIDGDGFSWLATHAVFSWKLCRKTKKAAR